MTKKFNTKRVRSHVAKFYVVGGFNPSEKCSIVNMGIFPKICGVNLEKSLNLTT